MPIKISPNRKVNTNPRPPNEPKIGVGNAKKVAGAQPGNSPAAKAQALKNKELAGQKQTEAALRAKSATSSSPAAVQPLGAADPRDAQYWETLSSLEFTKNKELENLHTEGVFDETSHGREKAELDRLNPIEQRNLRENANVGGEIYSSSTTDAANNLGIQQSNRSSSMQEAYQKLLFQRAKEKEGVEGQFNLGAREDFAGTAERASNAAREAKELAILEKQNEPEAQESEGQGNNGGGVAKVKAAKPQNAPKGKKWAWNGSQWHLVKA